MTKIAEWIDDPRNTVIVVVSRIKKRSNGRKKQYIKKSRKYYFNIDFQKRMFYDESISNRS